MSPSLARVWGISGAGMRVRRECAQLDFCGAARFCGWAYTCLLLCLPASSPVGSKNRAIAWLKALVKCMCAVIAAERVWQWSATAPAAPADAYDDEPLRRARRLRRLCPRFCPCCWPRGRSRKVLNPIPPPRASPTLTMLPIFSDHAEF